MLLNGIFRSVWQIKIQDITQKNDFAYCLHVRGFLKKMFTGALSKKHELKLLSQLFCKTFKCSKFSFSKHTLINYVDTV